MAKNNPIKKIYDLYMSDLSFDEIEKTIKNDSAEVYEFFKNDIPQNEGSKNKLFRALSFCKSLFNAFILRLSPTRRAFYIAALLIFSFGLIQPNNTYIFVGFLILNLLLAFELADKLLTKNELEVARKIQSDLIPTLPEKIRSFETSAHYESAKEVGGDYYDYLKVEDDKSIITIGDISGKGMPAAIYMVRVQAIMHTLVKEFNSLSTLIINLKNVFSDKLLPEYFLTLVAVSINKSNKIELCRAGHNPPLYFSKDENKFYELTPKGLAIGLKDHGKFEELLETATIEPAIGDILLLYTDGLTEMMNQHGQQFGLNNVKKIISENHTKDINEIKSKLLKAINSFKGTYPTHDDFTFILIRRQ